MKFKAIDTVKLRSTPSITSPQIGSVRKDALVDGDEHAWRQVTLSDGATGYCAAEYLQEVDDEPALTSMIATHFVVGQSNPATGPNTIEVRRVISDMYGEGRWGDALQCTEYVTYRIKLRGIDIRWPVQHGRNGGKWAAIFKAVHRYQVLTDPVPNCAMSFTAGISTDPQINEIGHVAWVEQVLPDGAVRISEANWPHDGIYNERTIPRSKWQGRYKAQFVYFG